MKIALAGSAVKPEFAHKPGAAEKLEAAVKEAGTRYCPAQELAGQAEFAPQPRSQFFQK